MRRSLSDYIEHLNCGKILAYPTETVWGLGVLANNSPAIRYLNELKGRDEDKAFSVLVRDKFAARKIVHIDEKIEKLLGIFWPGPVTFVLPAKNRELAENLGDSNFIGLRCSSDLFIQHLVNQLEAPLVTTSANRSGHPAAKNLSDLTWLPKEVKICVSVELTGNRSPVGPSDGFECSKEISRTGEPSLVVKIEGDDFFILRESKSRQQIFEIVAKDLGFR